MGQPKGVMLSPGAARRTAEVVRRAEAEAPSRPPLGHRRGPLPKSPGRLGIITGHAEPSGAGDGQFLYTVAQAEKASAGHGGWQARGDGWEADCYLYHEAGSESHDRRAVPDGALVWVRSVRVDGEIEFWAEPLETVESFPAIVVAQPGAYGGEYTLYPAGGSSPDDDFQAQRVDEQGTSCEIEPAGVGRYVMAHANRTPDATLTTAFAFQVQTWGGGQEP